MLRHDIMLIFTIFYMQLSRSPDTVVLCILFLKTISEELINSRAELSYTRKAELKRLLSQQVPSILALLSSKFKASLYFTIKTPPG